LFGFETVYPSVCRSVLGRRIQIHTIHGRDGVYIDSLRERLRATAQRQRHSINNIATFSRLFFSPFFFFFLLPAQLHEVITAYTYLPDGHALHVTSLARHTSTNALGVANITTIALDTAHVPLAAGVPPSACYGGADFSSAAAPAVGPRPGHAGALHAARGAVVVFAWLSAARCRDGRDEGGERSSGAGVVLFLFCWRGLHLDSGANGDKMAQEEFWMG
jgi:hypothetical protein